jgi:magnesium transporter
MIRSVYTGGESATLTDLEESALAQVLSKGTGLVWVDIAERDPRAEVLLRDTFQFHPLAIEDCFDDRVDTAKVDDYGDYLFIVAPYAVYDLQAEEVNIRELCVFLGASYVVSVHQRPIQPVHDIFDRATAESHILDRGPDFLVHSLLDAIVDELLPAIETMNEQLDDLERAVLDDPHHGHLTSILLLKRNALRLRRSLEAQRDMVNRLSRGEYPDFIRPDTAIFFRDVYDHIVRGATMIEGVRDLADDALSYYLTANNNRMTEIMKALSVVASVFLPLTLIASVFGTNLDYSWLGLTFDGGFYLMLAFMLLIAAGMFVFFRKRGWF